VLSHNVVSPSDPRYRQPMSPDTEALVDPSVLPHLYTMRDLSLRLTSSNRSEPKEWCRTG
jgi:hypothetical protein